MQQVWCLFYIHPQALIYLSADTNSTLPEVIIVNAARELDRMYAPISQVGIQFVQIGHDQSATEFLETLDNRLKSQHDVRVRSILPILIHLLVNESGFTGYR